MNVGIKQSVYKNSPIYTVDARVFVSSFSSTETVLKPNLLSDLSRN